MSLHDAISELNDVVFDTEGFAETVVYWPLGVEADAEEVGAIVDWDLADVRDNDGTTQKKTEVSIMLPVNTSVTANKDIFLITDPSSSESVKFVAVACQQRDEGAQIWELQRFDVREIARPGYRR